MTQVLLLTTSNQCLSNFRPNQGTSSTQNVMSTCTNSVNRGNLLQHLNSAPLLNTSRSCTASSQLMTSLSLQMNSTKSSTHIPLNPTSGKPTNSSSNVHSTPQTATRINNMPKQLVILTQPHHTSKTGTPINNLNNSNPIKQNLNTIGNSPNQILFTTNHMSNIKNLLPADKPSSSNLASNLVIPINSLGNASITKQNSINSTKLPNQIFLTTNHMSNIGNILPANISNSSSNVGIPRNSLGTSSTNKKSTNSSPILLNQLFLTGTSSKEIKKNSSGNANIAKQNVSGKLDFVNKIPGTIPAPGQLLLALVPISKSNNTTGNPLNISTGNKPNDSNSNKPNVISFKPDKNFGTVNKPKVLINSKASLTKYRLQKYKEQFKSKDCFCVVCQVECGTADLLNEHKEGKDFICRICTNESATHDELERHFEKHIVSECNLCKGVFVGRKDLVRHQEEKHSHEKTFKCEICNKGFLRKKALNEHKVKYHSFKVRDMFKCEVCGRGFKELSVLKTHSSAAHSAYEYIECKYCQKLILGPVKMKYHIKLVHIDSERNRPAACPICSKVFRTQNIMITHKRNLHEKDESLCNLCGKLVGSKRGLREHMQEKHSGTGVFICKMCNCEFETKYALKRHKIREHHKRTVPTTVFCEICGRLFKNSTILKNHMATHSDERPFKCEVCGATFRQLVALRTHGRVHSSVGEYNCLNCGMDFKWKQTLDNHVKKCMSDNKVDNSNDSLIG